MAEKTIALPYGKGTLRVRVPADAVVLEGNGGEPLADPATAVRKVLLHPAGTAPLPDLLRERKPASICIVVSDHTRAVPNRIILPALLDACREADIPNSAVFLLVAGGTHRQMTVEEKRELFGNDFVDRLRILDHCGGGEERLSPLRVGGDMYTVSRDYLAADFRILTGLIEPHFMAGFSGGRKAICPGLAGMETLRLFHGPGFLESPFSAPGILKDNPCHLFATRFAEAAGADFIVNATIDREKRATGFFCGALKEAFEVGAGHCRKENEVACDRRFDVVVTTNGGYPLDRDFYQTVKGLVGCLPAVKEGGVIICAAECRDGLGNADFRELLGEAESPDAFLKRILSPGFFRHDQWEVEELMKVLRVARVRLHSCLSPADVRLAHCEPIDDVETAVELAMKEAGPSASLAVIPGGPYTLVTGQQAL